MESGNCLAVTLVSIEAILSLQRAQSGHDTFGESLVTEIA